MPYLDEIFSSYREAAAGRGATITRVRWLDGDHGWRLPLRRIGELAERIAAFAAKTSPEIARQEWQRLTQTVYLWMPGYIVAVPVLRDADEIAKRNDAVFLQFMRDLATLAAL